MLTIHWLRRTPTGAIRILPRKMIGKRGEKNLKVTAEGKTYEVACQPARTSLAGIRASGEHTAATCEKCKATNEFIEAERLHASLIEEQQ